jgi:hypothetical protein
MRRIRVKWHAGRRGDASWCPFLISGSANVGVVWLECRYRKRGGAATSSQGVLGQLNGAGSVRELEPPVGRQVYGPTVPGIFGSVP